MNRITLPVATLALAAAFSLPATGAEPASLQDQVTRLENRVKTLEAALRELTKNSADPSPTVTGGTITPPPAPPAIDQISANKPAAPEAKVHTIAAGETVSIIAAKYGVPRPELLEANDLKEGQQIYIGDQLVIPQNKPATPKAPLTGPTPDRVNNPTQPSTGATTAYKVKAGDTLTKIARSHGTTITAIKAANRLSSDNLSVGQTLQIPAKGAGSSPSIATDTPTPSKPSTNTGGKTELANLLRPDETYGYYTIEKGDTLYSLARDFFTTPAELQRLNKMGTSTTLRPGQDVVVPTKKYEAHHNKLANNG